MTIVGRIEYSKWNSYQPYSILLLLCPVDIGLGVEQTNTSFTSVPSRDRSFFYSLWEEVGRGETHCETLSYLHCPPSVIFKSKLRNHDHQSTTVFIISSCSRISCFLFPSLQLICTSSSFKMFQGSTVVPIPTRLLWATKSNNLYFGVDHPGC